MEPTVHQGPWDRATFDRMCYEASNEANWYYSLRQNFTIHPAVLGMLAHPPKDAGKLVWEFPHVSEKDPLRLAYTRTPADGANNRKLITSIGKYISRHWPHVEDHLRRDAAALYTPDTMYFVNTLRDIVLGIELGPHSCMRSSGGFHDGLSQMALRWSRDNTREEPDWEQHPYASYDPVLGWTMALRKSPDGIIQGRAMCFDKMFVRTYRRNPEPGGYSHADETLAAWLLAQDYKHVPQWPETVLLRGRSDLSGYVGQIQMPYLDGNVQRVNHKKDNIYYVSPHGEYDASNTDGFLPQEDNNSDDGDDNDDDNRATCECCDENCHVDEMHSVGRHGDIYVCETCCNEEYTLVKGSSFGRRGGVEEYLVPNDQATLLYNRDEYIDINYPPPYVVSLKDGERAHQDDVVSIDDAFYRVDDPYIVELSEENPDTGDDFALLTDTWICAATGHRYHKLTECVVVDGEQYFPADAPIRDEQPPFVVASKAREPDVHTLPLLPETTT